MFVVSAEKNFNRGLEALADQNYVEAIMHFRRAMDIEHQRRILQPDMRYLSYYWLCRAKAHYKIEGGLHACKRAAQVRNQDPEMHLNLGRVYLMAQRKRQAYQAFQTGLDIEPGHEALNLESSRLAKRLPRNALPGRRNGFFARVRSVLSRPVSPARSR